jgi:hypothetical protein
VIKMGRRQGGPSRTGGRREHPAPFYAPIWFSPAGTKMVRDVTDEQRSRRPIFITTLWAGASWLFFRVARSTRMTQIWALRSRLEKQPTDLRQNTSYFGDRTLGRTQVHLRPVQYQVSGHSPELLPPWAERLRSGSDVATDHQIILIKKPLVDAETKLVAMRTEYGYRRIIQGSPLIDG